MKKGFVIFTLAVFVVATFFLRGKLGLETKFASASGLPSYTETQLKNFDGSDLNKPIYLALDGLVYDISLGKEFYQVGGVYHYLAGKDSSSELHLVGGEIIKRKYKVIGIFKQ